MARGGEGVHRGGQAVIRPELARTILALASGMVMPAHKAHAIDMVLLAVKLGAEKRPVWWRWTVWLAGAITCKRIEAA